MLAFQHTPACRVVVESGVMVGEPIEELLVDVAAPDEHLPDEQQQSEVGGVHDEEHIRPVLYERRGKERQSGFARIGASSGFRIRRSFIT